MALDKVQLKEDFKALFTDMRTREENADDEFAERFASLMDAYIKTAKINYTSGLVTPQGTVTGTFVGNLS
ncbi:hypothetical protein FHR24_001505 [Wenyingzhuangia heitensis]|uniref:Uncharacterized protein n=1 Tax=Wenyingzhuangia heitensis TaxID=1487859 RepID=A0ABX0UBY8_9FLAO|nr:phosphoglycerate kinase [Wenyingzhuangia heitensis]NIJ45066.1 hypothetical protein [Wenyingzhuangia heitensis]